MKYLKKFETKDIFNKDNYDRDENEFKIGDFVVCIDPYEEGIEFKVGKFEIVEVVNNVNNDDRLYGYITIKNKNGEIGTYFKNRLMPLEEFYAIKYNL